MVKDEGHRPTLRSFLEASGMPPERFLEALDILKSEIRAMIEDAPRAAPAPPPASTSPPPPQAAPAAAVDENADIRRILEEIKARWVQEDRAKAHAGSAPAPPVERVPVPPPAAAGAAVPSDEDILRTVVKTSGAAAPPTASPEPGRITVETVILKPPSGAPRIQPRPAGPLPPPPETPAPEEAPTAFLRVEPPAAPPPQAGDEPTTFLRAGAPPPPAPSTAEPPGEEGGEMLLETMVRTSGERPQRAREPERKAPPEAPPPADDQATTILRVETPPQAPAKPAVKPDDDDEMSKTVILRPDQAKGKGKGGRT